MTTMQFQIYLTGFMGVLMLVEWRMTSDKKLQERIAGSSFANQQIACVVAGFIWPVVLIFWAFGFLRLLAYLAWGLILQYIIAPIIIRREMNRIKRFLRQAGMDDVDIIVR